MDQLTFADLEYQGKKRKTHRELFLERMYSLIPWQNLEDRIRPIYPKPGRGRQPYPLSAMLRVHCVQLFYNLSDPGMEDLLYESDPVRRFVGQKLTGPLPDETTILDFRHLLEAQKGLEDYFRFYNGLRPHQALGYQTPAEVFHGEQGVVEGESKPESTEGGRGVSDLKR